MLTPPFPVRPVPMLHLVLRQDARAGTPTLLSIRRSAFLQVEARRKLLK